MSCGEGYPSCWGIDKLRRVAVPSRQQNISRPIIDQARSHGLSSLCWELPQTLDAGRIAFLSYRLTVRGGATGLLA